MSSTRPSPVTVATTRCPSVRSNRGQSTSRRDIEVAQDVDTQTGNAIYVAFPYQTVECVASRLIAGLLGPGESGRFHGDDRNSLLPRHTFADGPDVVADETGDAGGVHERRLGRILVNQFEERVIQFLLTAVDDILFLEVGRETDAVEFRSGGKRTANVPRVGRAPDGTMHQMKRVGDRVKDDPRPAEDAAALAHRPGHAFAVAIQAPGFGSLPVDLMTTFLQQRGHCPFLSFQAHVRFVLSVRSIGN
jgi:hypothetical protein